jgi:cellulose synthase/poly-beta-1,6-N-acetylglucosamine synthase-like glycosyltransferase
LEWFIIIIAVSYILFVIFLIKGWEGLKHTDVNKVDDLNITVLIPVRNEIGNVHRLVRCLEDQSYPRGNYEVIFIDDNSEDGTLEALRERSAKGNLKLKIIKLEKACVAYNSFKKAAITQGIRAAKGDYILLTDGDVHMGKHWIQSYASRFSQKDVKFISGPVVMESTNFLQDIQSIEFASLIGTGAAFIHYGIPVMCNGANLAFEKDVFWEVDGYEDNKDVVSGDDEFLMYKVHKNYPLKVSFLKSPHCLVRIPPVYSLKDFYYQRRRWSGKWKKHANTNSKILAVYIFIAHVSFMMLLLFLALHKIPLFAIILFFLIKLILEYFFFKNIFRFYAKPLNIFPFVISSLLYSIYAITFGILSNTGGYKWKGRQYKN